MVLGKRALVGLKYAVVPVQVTVPATEVTPCVKVKVVVVRVNGFIGSLKVAVTLLFRTTPVALSAGSVEITVEDRVVPVVKVHTYSVCNALPIKSFIDVATLPV
jgi:hypothetical protein